MNRDRRSFEWRILAVVVGGSVVVALAVIGLALWFVTQYGGQ